MKTKTLAAMCLLFSLLCSKSNSQILTVDQITGSASTEANAVDWLVNDLTDVPFGDCDMLAITPGLWGSNYGVLCGASANQQGTIPFHHETSCHTGSRAFLTGDNSQRIEVIWKNSVSNFSTSDAYWAYGEADLAFNANIALDQSPPGVDVTVYYHYSAFVGASTDHETDGFLNLEEDPIDVQTTLTLNGNDLLPTPFDFQNPNPNGGGISGWNSVKDVYGSLTMQQGQDFALAIASDIDAEINPLGKPWAGPFEKDGSDGIFHGRITFSLAPFIDVPVQTSSASLKFSLDIGSDSEYGDINQDGDEQFDPGDVYNHNAISPLITTYLDDAGIFGVDPLPDAPGMQIPYHGIPMDAFGPDVFDLDGFELSEWNLAYWADQLPILVEPSDCLPYPDYFLLSFDDDTKENWSDPFPSLPTESLSPSGLIFGEAGNKNEVVTAHSVGASGAHSQFPFMNEGLLHNALQPAPLSDLEDDDCDALGLDRISNGNSLCQYQYFSVDREGRFYDQVTGVMLNPGSIYQVMGGGIVSEVLTPSVIGIPDGTDIDAFTFGAQPNDDFLVATFALFFSVDEDDPMTPEDESGGLNPTVIYYSILNGQSWELGSAPFQDDIDAMTLVDQMYAIPGTTCADIYYQDNDGDGYGDSSTAMNSCSPIPGYVIQGNDCDDADPDVYSGAPGTAEGKDNDCDGILQGDEIICPGDFNGDGDRNTLDLLSFIANFGCSSNCGIHDMNGDGLVNSLDILSFLAVFGSSCP